MKRTGEKFWLEGKISPHGILSLLVWTCRVDERNLLLRTEIQTVTFSENNPHIIIHTQRSRCQCQWSSSCLVLSHFSELPASQTTADTNKCVDLYLHNWNITAGRHSLCFCLFLSRHSKKGLFSPHPLPTDGLSTSLRSLSDPDSFVAFTSLCVEQPSSSSSSRSPAALTESEETTEMVDSEPSVPSWEPMLCNEAEEGQAPLSLELLYHTAQTTSPSDAIMVAGNLLMLETGFIPQVRLRTLDLFSACLGLFLDFKFWDLRTASYPSFLLRILRVRRRWIPMILTTSWPFL